MNVIERINHVEEAIYISLHFRKDKINPDYKYLDFAVSPDNWAEKGLKQRVYANMGFKVENIDDPLIMIFFQEVFATYPAKKYVFIYDKWIDAETMKPRYRIMAELNPKVGLENISKLIGKSSIKEELTCTQQQT